MKTATAPDKRPAIAFDNKQEVLMTIAALKKYRDDEGLNSYFLKMIDTYEKVLEMFKGE